MFNRFRKILTVLIIVAECFCVSQVLHADDWSYDIETSEGTKTIVLPDGMTFEEAYIEMSKLYIEERIDHEKLIIQTQDLVAKAKEFEKASEHLRNLQNELIKKDEELSSLYKKLNRVHSVYFLATTGISTNMFQSIDSIDVGFGAEIFEFWVAIVEVSYPWSFGVKIGVRF